MNLMNILKKNKERALFTNAGIILEDREYSKEEIKKCALDIEEFIMSHSSKNGAIAKLYNEYYSILSTLTTYSS